MRLPAIWRCAQRRQFSDAANKLSAALRALLVTRVNRTRSAYETISSAGFAAIAAISAIDRALAIDTQDFGLDRLFAPDQVSSVQQLRVGLSETVIGLVSAGLGVALLPRWACSEAEAEAEAAGKIAIRPLWPKRVFREWKAVYRRQPQPSAHLMQFVSLLKARCSGERTSSKDLSLAQTSRKSKVRNGEIAWFNRQSGTATASSS